MMALPMFLPITQEKVSDAVMRQIESLILEGVLRPGDRLPPERELAKTLDVSRPSLRDALLSLEKRGLLVARQGGGTYIADVMRSVFADPIVPLFGKHERATTDLLEFRREVEGMAASYAALRATDSDIEILGSLFAAMEEARLSGDAKREAELDVEFHSAIVDAGHNVVLIQTLRSIYALLRQGVFHNRQLLYESPGARDQLLAQHRAIYDAIIARDPEAARAAAEAHMVYVSAEREKLETVTAREVTSQRRLVQLNRSRAAEQQGRQESRKTG